MQWRKKKEGKYVIIRKGVGRGWGEVKREGEVQKSIGFFFSHHGYYETMNY